MIEDDKPRYADANLDRVLAGLLGHMATGPSGVAIEIIVLLRSNAELRPDIREALAAALERGLFGNRVEELNEFGQPMPWLEIGGLGRHGRISEAINVRRNWLDAAEALAEKRSSGAKGYSVLDEVGSAYGLGIDGMKKANAFRNRFLDEIRRPGSQIVTETLNFWRDNKFDPDPSEDGPSGGDHFAYARTLYIEREAELSCK